MIKTIIAILIFAGLVFSGNLPNKNITPGDTAIGIMLMYVCNQEFLEKRPISKITAKKVFAKYGISKTENYVLDLLIPVNLGGNASIKNVWPQTRKMYIKKNKLENKLNWMICNAKLSMSEARTIIKTDWVSAYDKYVDEK